MNSVIPGKLKVVTTFSRRLYFWKEWVNAYMRFKTYKRITDRKILPFYAYVWNEEQLSEVSAYWKKILPLPLLPPAYSNPPDPA